MEWIRRFFARHKGEEEERVVFLNDTHRNAAQGFGGNFVRTTRYTVLTFLPKNLFEQMHRLANDYFIIIALLQVFTNLSPTGQYTTAAPLILILGISAVKDAIEDFARYRSDVETNNRPLEILNDDGEWETRPWKDLKVGNVVKVNNREFFPADLLLLCSTEPLGMTYIETSNLDGETNLKIRQALPETNEPLTGRDSMISIGGTHQHISAAALLKFQATLHCELPNNRLNDFDGYLEIDGKKFSVNNQQILLRGAQLRQCEHAIGMVVFSGYDTKVVRNSSRAPSKRSNIELRANNFVLVILFVMFGIDLGAALATQLWADNAMDKAWYLPDSFGNMAFVNAFATYLILLSTMVPISLYVTLEIVKMAQAFHINWDHDMYDPESAKFALSRTSGLNEELGQVEYIFSDKTGTLTQNLMEFRKCTVGPHKFGKGTTEIGKAAAMRAGEDVVDDSDPNWEKPDPMFNFQDDSFMAQLRDQDHPNNPCMLDYVTALAVCHTVIPEEGPEGLMYQAASPDEAALVAAARCFDFVFHTRTPKSVTVRVLGQDREFAILNVLEFNSDRKRMSVIVRDDQDRIRLFCKGADTKIFERLSPGQPIVDQTLGFLREFANEGLRTLAVGVREIDHQVWEDWNKTYEDASTSLDNRQKRLADAAEMIEKDLRLLGTTAIEDKLQDGVPDCIATLARANIKIWVLTGDKQETAINIGFACALLTEDMALLILNEDNVGKTRRAMQKRWAEYHALPQDEKEQVGIVIDGKTLEHVLKHEDLKMSFLELGKRSKAVVCCRVTPSQKAEVTTLVKVHDGRICLAIGDGANDVAMIQAAHVGIGISGKEGLQAVQSSDYAIAQFRFLKKLLLCHGHWNYRRVSRVITFNFYKNICLYMTQFWFGLYNLVTGQTLYEAWTQSTFNVFFTFLPIVAYGVLDKDVERDGLYAFPHIYCVGQNKTLFNSRMFAYWLSNALVHSVLCFLIPLFLFVSIVDPNGQDRGLYSMGYFAYTGIVYVCTGKVLLMTRSHNVVSVGSVVLTIVLWMMWLGIYSLVIMFSDDLTVWKLGWAVIDLPAFWLCTFLVPVAVLSRDFAWRSYKDIFRPSEAVRANLFGLEHSWDEAHKQYEQQHKQAQQERRKRSLHHRQSMSDELRKRNFGIGYAYSGSEGVNLSGKSEWDQLKLRLKRAEERKKRKKANKQSIPEAQPAPQQ